jgi:hypothetical protein
VGSATTDSQGFYSFEVPAQPLLDGNILVLEAQVGNTTYHSVLTAESLGVTASSLLAGSGAAATSSDISPITEAAYSRLNARGLDNFSPQGIEAVIASVSAALTNQDFAGQTPAQAAQTAENVATSDPNVEQAINQAQFTPTPTPTATPTPVPCVGDCNSYGQVTVDEILTMVNIALGDTPVTMCDAGDANHDGHITVDEIITAVNSALTGCPTH